MPKQLINVNVSINLSTKALTTGFLNSDHYMCLCVISENK